MAGQSKWANIQHRKGRQDAARSKLFSKLSKEITVAAKMGDPDPEKNPRLRLAVKEAKQNSVPKDVIERAIKKNGEDGIIINDYNVDVWCKKISNLITDKKKLDFIKRKLKNDNTQKSLKDIFFLKFDSNWKNLLKTQ